MQNMYKHSTFTSWNSKIGCLLWMLIPGQWLLSLQQRFGLWFSIAIYSAISPYTKFFNAPIIIILSSFFERLFFQTNMLPQSNMYFFCMIKVHPHLQAFCVSLRELWFQCDLTSYYQVCLTFLQSSLSNILCLVPFYKIFKRTQAK